MGGRSSATAPTGPVKLSGAGDKRTKPFLLAAGDYEVDFSKGKACNDDLTYAILERTDGGSVSGGWFDQSGYAYAVDAGRHYWDVSTSPGKKCRWTLTIKPL